MIKYEPRGITYKVRPNTWLTPWVEHAATAYGFLLNTSERRGKWHTWKDFADLMVGYTSHVTTALIAEHVRAEGKALAKEGYNG